MRRRRTGLWGQEQEDTLRGGAGGQVFGCRSRRIRGGEEQQDWSLDEELVEGGTEDMSWGSWRASLGGRGGKYVEEGGGFKEKQEEPLRRMIYLG